MMTKINDAKNKIHLAVWSCSRNAINIL